MAGGRPEILNDALMAQICNCISIGLSIVSACAYCNISRETFYQWKKIGKQKPDSIYGLFLSNIKKANVQGEIKLLTDLQNDLSWQSKAWILERRWPKRWGKKHNIEIKPVSFETKLHQTTLDFSNLSVDELRQLKVLSDKAKKDEPLGIEQNDSNDYDNFDEMEKEPDE